MQHPLTTDDVAYEEELLLALVDGWTDGPGGDGMAEHSRSRVLAVGHYLLSRSAEHGFLPTEVYVRFLAEILEMAPAGVRRGLRYLADLGVVELLCEVAPDVWLLEHRRLGGLAPAMAPPYIATTGVGLTSYLVLDPQTMVAGAKHVVLRSLPNGERDLTAIFEVDGQEVIHRCRCHLPQPGELRAPLPLGLRQRRGVWAGKLL